MSSNLKACFALAVLITSPLPAQDLLAIKAGTVYQGRGKALLKNVVLLVRDSRIEKMGKDLEIPWNATVIDAEKKYVMPAWVLAHGSGGLDRENENMPVTPYLTVMDSVDPSHSYFETARRGGIGVLHILPGNSCQVGGRGVLLKPFGKTPEDMALVEKAGMKLSLKPTRGRSRSQHLTQLKKAFEEALEHRKELLRQKKEWEEDKANGATTEESFDLEKKIDKLKKPLLDLIDGKIPAYIYIPGPSDVPPALQFVKKYGLKGALILGPDCYKAIDILKNAKEKEGLNLALILDPKLEVIDKDPVTLEESLVCSAKVFFEADLPFALSSVSSSGRWRRGSSNPALTLPWWQVATCVRHGIPEDVAIAAFTEMPALILNREERFGRLAEGMDANIQILKSAPMEPDSQVEMLIVEGEIIYDRSKDPRVKALTGKTDPSK